MSAQEPYFESDDVTLLCGDAREVLAKMPRRSVDCIVTNPPYYGLRDYGIGGQIGLEQTLSGYVSALRSTFAYAHRVLADDGTLWLNLGDSYSTTAPGGRGATSAFLLGNRTVAGVQTGGQKVRELPLKNLLGIPWRVAFALQDEGWVLRADVIWAKRNFMPEAVKDRPTRSHEYVFMFTKGQRYFYDADAIREESDPEQEAHNQRYAREYAAHSGRAATTGQPGNVNSVGIHSRPGKGGRNARTVWTISNTPSPEAHFATFPEELPRRCIAAGCKPGGVVLDPFSGSGTTGRAARALGRRYVGIDLNPAFHDIGIKHFAQGTLLATSEEAAS